MKTILSKSNPDIKLIQGLKKKRNRDQSGLYIIEGKKELLLAQKNQVEIQILNICPEYSQEDLPDNFANIDQINQLSPEIFASISYRENPDGYLAVAVQRDRVFQDLQLSQPAFILILENVEKPGNLGAVLRTADACGVDAVILDEQQTDIYNPNVIRASLGAFFTVPVIRAQKAEITEFLAKNNIKTVATTPLAEQNYTNISYKQNIAVLVGEEHRGLSDFWLKSADNQVLIPMLGQIDSLNASVSAAILAYEVVRQRQD